MIALNEDHLRAAIHQLRQIASYIEEQIPADRDADLPLHQRAEYIARSRTFADAFAGRHRNARKRGSK